MQLPHVVEFNPWNSGRILLNVRKSTQINVHRREIALAHVTENLEMHSFRHGWIQVFQHAVRLLHLRCPLDCSSSRVAGLSSAAPGHPVLLVTLVARELFFPRGFNRKPGVSPWTDSSRGL